MIDNVGIGPSEDFARRLCSEQALGNVDALPALLRHDTLDELLAEYVDIARRWDAASKLLAGFEIAENFDKETADTLIREEYLARKCLEAYETAVAIREREAGVGVH